jgi:hypothetical protein
VGSEENIRILFADDQLPDEKFANLDEEDVKAKYKEIYRADPRIDAKWIADIPKMRKAVYTLRDAGYSVDVARTVKEALSKISKSHYNLAIIDLNWYGDYSIPLTKRVTYGLKICKAIDEANKKMRSKQTFQIIYSSLLEFDAESKADLGRDLADISKELAAKGKLPLYKKKDSVGHGFLKETVKFIEYIIKREDPKSIKIRQLRLYEESVINNYEEARKQQSKWFIFTIGAVAISFGLMFGGAFGAIVWNVQVGTLTSIFSLLTTAISGILLKEFHRAQKTTSQAMEKIHKTIDYITKKLDEMEKD